MNRLQTYQVMLWFSLAKIYFTKGGNSNLSNIFLCPLKLWEITANLISLHCKHQGNTLCLFDYCQYMEPRPKVKPRYD